jgi:lipid-A-disaccharide synthase
MFNGKNIDADRPLRVMISAGEASGEMYGAELLTALRGQVASTDNGALPAAGALSGEVDCFGMGGERMREAGCEIVVDARDVAVVGLFEVLGHLPRIYREFHKLLAEVDRRRPDVAVLIDFPDWNFRLAKQLRRRGIPVVYYVSPQLWAWRKGRLKLVQRDVSEMLVIIPFEREFYARNGVEVEFVGHPLSELEPPKVSREEFAQRWGLDAGRTWIALLPGSRKKELRLNLPAMLGAAERLGPEFEFVMPVASTLDRDWVREQVAKGQVSRFQSFKVSRFEGQEQGREQDQQPHPSQRRARMGHPEDNSSREDYSSVKVVLTDDARGSLLHARVGVVASGTATVEAALIGTPFVMVYRVAGLTWMLGRHLVKLPHYGMVNLVAGREVVPELIQNGFTAERVEREVRRLLDDGEARQRMSEALAQVRGRLRGESADADIQHSQIPHSPNPGGCGPPAGDIDTPLKPTAGLNGPPAETTAERAARAVLRVAERAGRR